MNNISLPILPNSPIKKGESTLEGQFRLRKYGEFGFVQNVAFDELKIEYGENYQNDQSNSLMFKNHMQSVYQILKSNYPKGAKLVEVGCGKGAFLEIVKYDKHFTYKGFDAAYEGADENIETRYLTTSDIIDADVVVLRHTLEHIKNPHKFISFLTNIFPSTASIFIEVPQFEWIEKNKVIFDFTYEHVNYFNTESLLSFFSEIEGYGDLDLVGGQYQYCLAKLSSFDNTRWVGFDDEKQWADFDFSLYEKEFEIKLTHIKNYERIWVWGGATKGVLFLKHLSQINPILFSYVKGVIDINPKKQNHFTPSTYFEIISPSTFFDACSDGDAVLVMNPNYIDEIKSSIEQSVSKKLEVISFCDIVLSTDNGRDFPIAFPLNVDTIGFQ